MAGKTETNIKVNPEKVRLETDQGIIESEERKWGLPLKDVYKHGFAFYKEKEGKAIHLSYEDRLKLVAYTQQTAHGPLEANSAPPLGVLDVIGRDRRAAWQALGQMSQIQSMAGFVHTLDRLCPLFKPFLEAILKDVEDKRQRQIKREVEERSHMELQNRIMEEKQKQQSNKVSEEQQVQRIKDALNAQTYEQFVQYAQQQCPDNVEQQAVLIRQLQEQHYQQYVRQLAADRRRADSCERPVRPVTGDERPVAADWNLNDTDVVDSDNNKSMQTSQKIETEISETEVCKAEDDQNESETEDIFPTIEEARMWTRTDIQVFKDSAQASGGKLNVSHGETVTVRVPTSYQGRCICWEFATDNYDIGFGMYFEWSKVADAEVTVVISDSDEDEEDNDDAEREVAPRPDPEMGEAPRAGRPSRAPLSLVLPIYRRDSHTEVYAGSHTYPGEGVYLLKFDNTYSLWRSKALYYKVYYTQ